MEGNSYSSGGGGGGRDDAAVEDGDCGLCSGIFFLWFPNCDGRIE